LAKIPDFGHFSGKSLFLAVFQDFRTLPRGGFYINPSRRHPRSLPEAQKEPFPGNPRGGPKKAIFGRFRAKSPILGIFGLPGPLAPPDPPRSRGTPVPGSRGGSLPPQEEGLGRSLRH